MTAKPIRAPSMRNPNFRAWTKHGRSSCAALDAILGQTYDPLGDNVSCVALVNYMGTEADILRAARMSTGKEVGPCDENGCPTEPQDQRLLPRLLKDCHTSPFEVPHFSFIIQCPIFVARQWVRHRTASYNEASGRYTILDVELYMPDGDSLRFEQGTEITSARMEQALDLIGAAQGHQESTYDALIGLGVHREQARIVLGTALYTRMLVTVDLHNLMHFLTLRLAPDAQYEIRQFAWVLWAMVAQMSPMCAANVAQRVWNAHPAWMTAPDDWVAWVKPAATNILNSYRVPEPYRDPALNLQESP